MYTNKGFSLIELIIVITIISILAAIAIPAYVGQQKKAVRTEAYSNLESLRLLEEQFFAENGVYAPTAGDAGANHTDNVALIRAAGVLPGFRPGKGVDLSFSYQIVQNQQITSANPLAYGVLTPCFTAIATGNTGSRVAGDIYAIDCNNNRNF